jgi:hypothetical protein
VALLLGLAVAVAVAPAPARAANTLEIVALTGDPDNRIDLVIMAEGFTPAQADLFRDHVDLLLDGFFAYGPWDDYRGAFNLYRIVTESNESGADHPSQGIYVDTYLDATFDYLGVERLLVVNDALAASVAATLLPEVDFVVVLVNDPLYGGSGGSVATVSATDVAVQILTHELGHSFAGLADEYTDAYPGYPPGDDEPNVDFDFAIDQLKWSAWVEPGTPLPTLLADAVDDYHPVGAYEGARYLETGIYRSAPWCMMRSVAYDYCAVCAEALVLSIYDWVEPIDDATPTPGMVSMERGDPGTYPVRFEVAVPDLGGAPGLSVTWWLDEQEVGTGTSLALGPTELGPTNGSRTLRCVVTDLTPWVRSDPQRSRTGERAWTVSISGAVPDAGVGVDGGGEPGPDPRGCGCRTSASAEAIGLALLLALGWLAIRRWACRTRGTAWRRQRGPW